MSMTVDTVQYRVLYREPSRYKVYTHVTATHCFDFGSIKGRADCGLSEVSFISTQTSLSSTPFLYVHNLDRTL